MVGNREIFIPHLYLAPSQGVTASEFRDMFDAGKTRMIGLPYGEKYDDMLNRFHLISEHHGQTDGQNCYQYRGSASLTHDKNQFVINI